MAAQVGLPGLEVAKVLPFTGIALTSCACPGGVAGLQVTKVFYSDTASAQVGFRALKVTKVSLFAVIPPLPRWGLAPSKLPKYRYLQ